MHSGEVGTPKQDDKLRFLDAMEARLPELVAHNPLAVVVGDLNVAHRSLDIKNWKGNRKSSGFLPEERAYLDRFVGAEGDAGLQRRAAASAGSTSAAAPPARSTGPYTWWSWRGQTFANDAGWRIDYHLASPALAERVDELRRRPGGHPRRALVRPHPRGRRLPHRLLSRPLSSHPQKDPSP